MGRAAVVATMMAVVLGVLPSAATAQRESTSEVAFELARMAMDDAAKRRVDEQVTNGLIRTMGSALQERLSRRLLDVEWRQLGDIVVRFVRDTLPARRIEEIAADVYIRHFDDAELRELLAFQRSTVGRKLARLSATLSADTTRAIDAEIRASAATADMLGALRRYFPVLGTVESP